MDSEKFLTGKVGDQFWALAVRIVPPAADLDEAGRTEMLEIIDHAFRIRPASIRRQMKLFLAVIDLLSRLRGLRAFRGLSPQKQERVLASLDRSPVQALRQGFWGLKTFLLMGYYGRPEAGTAIGYHPLLRGGGLVATEEAP